MPDYTDLNFSPAAAGAGAHADLGFQPSAPHADLGFTPAPPSAPPAGANVIESLKRATANYDAVDPVRNREPDFSAVMPGPRFNSASDLAELQRVGMAPKSPPAPPPVQGPPLTTPEYARQQIIGDAVSSAANDPTLNGAEKRMRIDAAQRVTGNQPLKLADVATPATGMTRVAVNAADPLEKLPWSIVGTVAPDAAQQQMERIDAANKVPGGALDTAERAAVGVVPYVATGPAAPAIAGLSAAGDTRIDIARRRQAGEQISGGEEAAAAVGSGLSNAAMMKLKLGAGERAVQNAEGSIVRNAAGALPRTAVESTALSEAGNTASNFIAKQTYDPNRPITQGAGDAAIAGLASSVPIAAGGAIRQGIETNRAETSARLQQEAQSKAQFDAEEAKIDAHEQQLQQKHRDEQQEIASLADENAQVIARNKARTTEPADLRKMKLAELQQTAKDLGVDPAGKKQTDLLRSIVQEQRRLNQLAQIATPGPTVEPRTPPSVSARPDRPAPPAPEIEPNKLASLQPNATVGGAAEPRPAMDSANEQAMHQQRQTRIKSMSEDQLRALPPDQLRQAAADMGVHFDAPSTTIPRILDASDRASLEQMSDKDLWDEVRDRGLKAGSRRQNIETLLNAPKQEPADSTPAPAPAPAPAATPTPVPAQSKLQPESGQAGTAPRQTNAGASNPPAAQESSPPAKVAGAASSEETIVAKPARSPRQPKGIARADFERELMSIGEQLGVHSDDVQFSEQLHGEHGVINRANTTFYKKLPGEVRSFLEGRPEARRFFRVTDDPGQAHGADAMSEMGDRYFDQVEHLSRSKLGRSLEAARNSDNPRHQMVAAIYDALETLRSEGTPRPAQEKRDPGILADGTEFTMLGHKFNVEEDADGIKMLRDGDEFPVLPAEAVGEIPIDKDSVREAELPEVPDFFPPEYVQDKLSGHVDAETAARAAETHRQEAANERTTDQGTLGGDHPPQQQLAGEAGNRPDQIPPDRAGDGAGESAAQKAQQEEVRPSGFTDQSQPGIFGQPTIAGSGVGDQKPLFHEPVQLPPAATEKPAGSGEANNPQNTAKLFDETKPPSQRPRRGFLQLPEPSRLLGAFRGMRERVGQIATRYGDAIGDAITRFATTSRQALGIEDRFRHAAFGDDLDAYKRFVELGAHYRGDILEAMGKTRGKLPALTPAEVQARLSDPKIAKAIELYNRDISPLLSGIRAAGGQVMNRRAGSVPFFLNLVNDSEPSYGSRPSASFKNKAFNTAATGLGEYEDDPIKFMRAAIGGHLANAAKDNLVSAIDRISTDKSNLTVEKKPGEPDKFYGHWRGEKEPFAPVDLNAYRKGAQGQNLPPDLRFVPEPVKRTLETMRPTDAPSDHPLAIANRFFARARLFGNSGMAHALRNVGDVGARLGQNPQSLLELVPWIGSRVAAVRQGLRMKGTPLGGAMQQLVDGWGASRGQGFGLDVRSKTAKALNFGHELIMDPEHGTDPLGRRVLAHAYLLQTLEPGAVQHAEAQLKAGASPVKVAEDLNSQLSAKQRLDGARYVNTAMGFLDATTRSPMMNRSTGILPYIGTESGMIPNEIKTFATGNLKPSLIGKSIGQGEYGKALRQLGGQLASGPLGTFVALQALNFASSKLNHGQGRFTWDNPDGHRLDVELPGMKGWYLSNLDPGFSRAARLLAVRAGLDHDTKGAGGVAKDLGRENLNEALSTLSPMIHAAVAGLSGRDAYMTRGQGWGKATVGEFTPVAGNTLSSLQRGDGAKAGAIKDAAGLLGMNVSPEYEPKGKPSRSAPHAPRPPHATARRR